MSSWSVPDRLRDVAFHAGDPASISALLPAITTTSTSPCHYRVQTISWAYCRRYHGPSSSLAVAVMRESSAILIFICCVEIFKKTSKRYIKTRCKAKSALARPAIPLAACVHSSQRTTSACVQRPTLHYYCRMLPRHLANIAETHKLNYVAGGELCG